MKRPVAARLDWRTGLLAGLALIVGTNAVTLGLVAWNRSGKPEAVLTLSERELDHSWDWRGRRGENSGLALTLRWRVVARPAAADHAAGDSSYADLAEAWDYGGQAAWLDDAKLTALGFARDPPSWRDQGRARTHGGSVLLVLEIDGAAHRQAIEWAARHLARETALRDANPGKPEFAERVKRAEELLADQRQTASRLFVIDAGRNRAALRAQYPDRRRHAIVAGRIRPGWHDPRRPEHERQGYIESVEADTLSVPLALRAAVPAEPGDRRAGRRSGAFVAEVAFGRRLEPWLLRLAAAGTAAR